MFVNVSNHPSAKWGDVQMAAAQQWGKVYDIPFPVVAPDACVDAVSDMADDLINQILRLDVDMSNVVVHIMGEMTLTYAVVRRLLAKGVRCVASTTQRVVIDLPDGSKQSSFSFVAFRDYC